MRVVLDLDIIILPFDAFQNNQKAYLSKLLCKLILIIYRFIVSLNSQHSSMAICIHPIVIYCLHPRRKTVVFV